MSSSRDCDIYGVAVNIPPEFADRLMDAIDSVMEPVYPGYRRCFYYYPVKGTWKTMESAKPYDGVPGEITVAEEIRIKFVCRKEDIAGGSPEENARITMDILRGKKGPRYDTVLLNAGAGLYVSGKADDLGDGVELADKLLSDGKALEQFERFRKASQQ